MRTAMALALGVLGLVPAVEMPFIQERSTSFAEDPYDAVGSHRGARRRSALRLLSLARGGSMRVQAGRRVCCPAAPSRRPAVRAFAAISSSGLGVMATLATDAWRSRSIRGPGGSTVPPRSSSAGWSRWPAGAAVTLPLLTLAWRRLDRRYRRAAGASTYRRRMLAEAALMSSGSPGAGGLGVRAPCGRDDAWPAGDRVIAQQPRGSVGDPVGRPVLDHPWWTLALVAAAGRRRVRRGRDSSGRAHRPTRGPRRRRHGLRHDRGRRRVSRVPRVRRLPRPATAAAATRRIELKRRALRRRHVLVAAEQVVRVVAALDRRQPVPGRRPGRRRGPGPDPRRRGSSRRPARRRRGARPRTRRARPVGGQVVAVRRRSRPRCP